MRDAQRRCIAERRVRRRGQGIAPVVFELDETQDAAPWRFHRVGRRVRSDSGCEVSSPITAVLERPKESRAHQRAERRSAGRGTDVTKAIDLWLGEAKAWHHREFVSQSSDQTHNGHAFRRGKGWTSRELRALWFPEQIDVSVA